jgi:hypothetical protein
MVKHIHVPIPNQRSESATSHVIKEGAVRTALTIDQRAFIENILQTLPRTTTVAVVAGDAPIERFWVQELRQVVQPLENRVDFIFLTSCHSETP